jgi:hypothetical protein
MHSKYDINGLGNSNWRLTVLFHYNTKETIGSGCPPTQQYAKGKSLLHKENRIPLGDRDQYEAVGGSDSGASVLCVHCTI